MARRMLIDASHPEETRVVVVDGTKLTEFDFETASRKPLKGNIYLAKVIRIEPSLQAAFVEYGGNRHGFLAFSEIHADYYQIPVADRERLIAEQQRMMHAEADDEPESEPERIDRTDIEEAREDAAAVASHTEEPVDTVEPMPEVSQAPVAEIEAAASEAEPAPSSAEELTPLAAEPELAPQPVTETAEAVPAEASPTDPIGEVLVVEPPAQIEASAEAEADPQPETQPHAEAQAAEIPVDSISVPAPVEELGGDDVGEEPQSRERRRRQPTRQYKIQEVIKRRQILLVQVVKEERGNKGAALTTFLSLAGRYCVLMPNAGRGGGISRKISNPQDRKRMKEMLAELEVPQGMGVILRTAGLERSNIDIKRDYEYLSRLWDSIRELTMRSTAPALIYEEGDLIKRSLRDIYDTDIAQVLVEGEEGFQAASGFMRQLVPHQADKVQIYRESIPLFHRYQVEAQFDAMHLPTVQLRSGGYIVINPTEALVAIDVNSGRSTKERNIEETALRTNLEAAEEVARQVRLRDLAGLIVVDFIDMEENRHQRQVEHKMKDAMRNDRARIQIGRISAFGLLEMSRQRLRPSLLEHSTEICPHCAGVGRVRSIESAALHALRTIEEEGVRRRSSEIIVSVPPNVALYVLNQKRHALTEIEQRYAFHVTIESDDELHAADCEIERVRPRRDDQRPTQELARASYDSVVGEETPGDDVEPHSEASSNGEAVPERERSEGDEASATSHSRRRRRRRRSSSSSSRDDNRPQGEGEDRSYATAENGHDAPSADDEQPEIEVKGDSVIGEQDGQGQQASDDQERREHHSEGESESNGDGSQDDGTAGDGAAGDGAATADGADASRRRRGRRGGRRRRSPDQSNGAEHGGDQPAAMPFDGQPVEQMPGGHMPVEQAPWQPAAMTEAAPVAPPPTISPPPEPVVAQAPQPVPAPEQAELLVEPPSPPPPPAVVIPTISTDAPPEKPKRGWWRR